MAATRRADDVDHGAEMDRYMAAVREVQGDAYTDAKYSAGKYLSSETRDVCDRPLMAGDTFGMYFRLCARPDTAPNAVAADAQRLEAAGWDVACETDDEGRRVIHAFKSTTVTDQ